MCKKLVVTVLGSAGLEDGKQQIHQHRNLRATLLWSYVFPKPRTLERVLIIQRVGFLRTISTPAISVQHDQGVLVWLKVVSGKSAASWGSEESGFSGPRNYPQ